MKRILSILLVFICFKGFSQYNPSNFTVSNKSYGVAQSVSTDARSWFYDATNFVMRDYNGTSEVLSYLNLSKYRSGHFPVYVHSGGTLSGGAWSGGITLVYWFKNGTADANLVRWYTDSTIVTPEVDTMYRKNDSTIGFTINHGAEQTILIRGTAAGGINSLTFHTPSSLFNNPINFTNTGGTWDGIEVLNNQNPNYFFAGPSIGSPGQPLFRLITTSDLPTGIPNGNLQNASLTFGIGSSGTSPNFSSSFVALGGTVTLNLPTASNLNSGILSSADWIRFNTTSTSAVTSVNGRTGAVISKNADSLKGLPIDTTVRINGSALLWDSINKKYYFGPAGSGSGSVTTFSAGNLSGLFSTSVANPTSTPALSFSLTSQSANLIFASPNGSSGTPTFRSIINADLPISGVGAGTYNTVTVNAQGIVTGGSSAGSGITSLNGLTNISQIFSTGTSGSDFNIVSVSSTHTFNFPNSSASNRGLLTSTDWTTFNNKQGTLTLTTSGSSGAATLIGNTLNIPQYSGGGGTDSALLPGYGIIKSVTGTSITLRVDTSLLKDTISLGFKGVGIRTAFPSLGKDSLYFKNVQNGTWWTAVNQSDSSWKGIVDSAAIRTYLNGYYAPIGAIGSTNLSVFQTSLGDSIRSSNGTSAFLPIASGTLAGALSPTDWTKLQHILTIRNYRIGGTDTLGVSDADTLYIKPVQLTSADASIAITNNTNDTKVSYDLRVSGGYLTRDSVSPYFATGVIDLSGPNLSTQSLFAPAILDDTYKTVQVSPSVGGGYTFGYLEEAAYNLQTGYIGIAGISSAGHPYNFTGGAIAGNSGHAGGFYNSYIFGFSAVPLYDNTGGTIATYGGYTSALSGQGGKITNAVDFSALEFNTVNRTTLDTLRPSNHIAYYSQPFVKAIHNYGLYIQGIDSNWIAGKTWIGGGGTTVPTDNGAALQVIGKISTSVRTAYPLDTVNNKYAGFAPDGTIVILPAPIGGGGFTSPMTTAGDIIFENATPAAARLAIGSTSSILMVVGGLPSWQGQTQITSLGTITTGTWNGTVIDGAHGGTGVANTGKTITLGGNLITSGAFTTTLTETANTSITLPTSGTLYGTAASSFSSANLSASLSDETGTGTAVFSGSPTFTGTPIFPAATSAGSSLVLSTSAGTNPTTPTTGMLWWNGTNLNFRTGSTTIDLLADVGVTSVGTFSGSSIANGASITGNAITFGPADGTNPGMVTTGSQTFAGAKTFSSSATFSAIASKIILNGSVSSVSAGHGAALDGQNITVSNQPSGSLLSPYVMQAITYSNSSSVTYTDEVAGLYVGTPIAGTNTTFTTGKVFSIWANGDVLLAHPISFTAASIASGAGAGAGPTVSLTGTDVDGVITITTGTLPTASGIVATITYNLPFSNNSFPVITPANALTAALNGIGMVYTSGTTTNFTITSGTTALSATTTYKWYYHVGGN